MHFTFFIGLCLVAAVLLITLADVPTVQAQFGRFPMSGMGFPMGYRGFGGMGRGLGFGRGMGFYG